MSRTGADTCVEACQILGREFRGLYGALPWAYCRGHAQAVWAACPEGRLDWQDAEPLIHAAWAAEPLARGRPVVPAGTVYDHSRAALARVQETAAVSRALLARAPSVMARGPRARSGTGG